MLSLLYVTQSAAQWLVDLEMNRWVLMLAINVFLLVAGCFLPPVAIILMVMPILTPVLEAAHFDLIWFAVILTINMEVGLITPPVGLNLYVLKGVAPDVPLPTVLKGSLAVRAADVPRDGADRGLSRDRAVASRQDDELSGTASARMGFRHSMRRLEFLPAKPA